MARMAEGFRAIRTAELELAISQSGTGREALAAFGTVDSVRDQTLSALVNLGYPKAHAEKVLDAALEDTGPEAGIEELVRASLKRLAR